MKNLALAIGSPDVPLQVFARQVALLYEHTPASLAASLLASGLVMLILWGSLPSVVLIGWFAVSTTVTFARLTLTKAYSKAAPPAAEARNWAHRFYVGAFVAGCVWGFCSTTLIPINNPEKWFAMAFMITGLAAGGLSSLAPTRAAFPLFMVPIVLPLSIHMLMLGGTEQTYVGIAGLLFITMLLVVAARTTRTIVEALRLQFQNADLVHELGSAKLFADAANEELKIEIQMRQEAQATAEAASKAKSQFLANMSHEIRTPMNGVLGMTELLLGTELNSRQRRFTETVHRSGEALLKVINDILDFSKIEAGKLELEAIDFNLRELIEDTCELLAERAHAKGLELACDIEQNVPQTCVGDPGRIRQILTNLVGNAVKFTEQGEVIVRVRVSKEIAESQCELEFKVTDTGPGIAEEAHGRIFDAFAQADGSTTRKHGGTGLGLSIAKQLAQMMGGDIGMETASGKGSTFWFSALLGKRQENSGERAKRARSLRGLRVLVVDDNATNREIMLQQMNGWGVHVESAVGGAEALAKLDQAKLPFDLAILDLHMPEMDGLQLARRIQAQPHYEKLLMMVLSSVGQLIQAEEIAAARISYWLTKPVRQSELFNHMAELTRDTLIGKATPGTEALTHSVGVTGGRILLVEDNVVNQEVALAMLETLGCDVDLAADGAKAISALNEHAYDLVLMDCQLPVMDGFEATAAIRQKEQATGRHQIVIALTANAMQGDKERCLAAGMDDYLAKPFEREQLRRVLQKWLAKSQASAVAPPLPAPAKINNDAIDPAILGNILSLQRPGAPSVLKKLVGLYLESAPQLISALQTGIHQQNPAAIKNAAHTLKSSSANLGARKLSEICKAVEGDMSSGHGTGTLQAQFEQIEAEYEHARIALLRECEKV